MRKLWFTLLVGSLVLATSCSKEKARLSGKFVGSDSTTLYLERLLPTANIIVDTTVTDDKGNFGFNVVLPQGQTTMFNLRCDNYSIPLLISSREKIKINSVGNIARNYTIDGSPESERVRELMMLLGEGSIELDSILKNYLKEKDIEKKRELGRSYNKKRIKIKQEQIKYIVSEPGKLSSLYGLYQRLLNEEWLTDDEAQDLIYYRTVADSAGQLHPESPYVKALKSEIERRESSIRLADMFAEKLISGETDGFPDLTISDMYGVEQKLSDLTGKVILLEFWSVLDENATIHNAELKNIYNKFHDRGFEVYQVSVDNDATKPLWVRKVQQQQLPWISVGEFKSENLAARKYNVNEVPCNFVINRSGDIVARDVHDTKLTEIIERLL